MNVGEKSWRRKFWSCCFAAKISYSESSSSLSSSTRRLERKTSSSFSNTRKPNLRLAYSSGRRSRHCGMSVIATVKW
jgi:hypothetical protein